MGRAAKPWYRKDRRLWCVVIDGKRITLGPDKAEAYRRYHEIMSGGSASQPDDARKDNEPSGAVTFAEVIDRYLADLRHHVTPMTVYHTRNYMKPFVRAFGTEQLRAIKKRHVDEATRAHGKWGPTAEHMARGRLVSALNWAVEMEIIDSNPLDGLKRPGRGREGRERSSTRNTSAG